MVLQLGSSGQHSQYDSRLGFSFRVLVRVRVRVMLGLGLGLV